MDNENRAFNYFKIQQIDAIKGIITPHARDLKDLGKNRIDIFRKLSKENLNEICIKSGGKLTDMDLGENWAFSKDVMKDVTILVAYQYYGDEFGEGEEDEIQYFFSGEKISMISGEDLIHYCEIISNFMEFAAINKSYEQVYSGTPSFMLKTALKERTAPFYLVEKETYPEVAEFIGADYKDDNHFNFKMETFPGFKIELELGSGLTEKIEFKLDGDLISKLPVYDTERLVIMMINQCLRKIKLILDREGKKSPKICNLMFSGYYKKKFPEKFE